MSSKRVGAVLFIPAGIAFGLGVWQMQRRDWKLRMIEQRQRGLNDEPRRVPGDDGRWPSADEWKALHFRPVRFTGTFEHEREMLVGPRSSLESDHAKNRGEMSQSGFHVVTPVRHADGTRLLVNRGWIPRSRADPAARADGQVTGEVEIIGLARDSEVPTSFTPDSDGRQHFIVDRAAMCPEAVVLVDQCMRADGNNLEYPMAGQTRTELRNEHLNYAMTWFTMSAAVGLAALIKLRR